MNSHIDSSVSVGVSMRIRASHTLAMATFQGGRSLHSELLTVRLLFEGGDYSRVMSNRKDTTLLCFSEYNAVQHYT